LTLGGRLVATVEHPIFTAPTNADWQERDGRGAIWPLDGYLNEGQRTTTWFADEVIKYHRTIGTYVSALVKNDFRLTGLIEWGPSPDQIRRYPGWARERDRPVFMLLCAGAVE
jgi:hypothetical protein